MNIDELKMKKYGITHSGTFHCDDVFSSAFLKIINPSIIIKRVPIVEDSENAIVFDIGLGEFDHHQVDNETRPDGSPYAAFGKLWRAFAPQVYGQRIASKIDERFIKPLDISDNTGTYDSLCKAISLFNTEDDKLQDECFNKAVDFAKIILENLIEKELSHEKDSLEVRKYYDESTDKRIIILDKHMYFKDYLPYTKAMYVVYPNKRGGYAAEAVTKSENTIVSKKAFPREWLTNLPKGITFCHNSRFLIVGNTLEDVVSACKESLNDR